MFKLENRIYWYLIGTVIMMFLLLYVGREYLIPFFKGETYFGGKASYEYSQEPKFTLDTSKNYFATIYTNYGVIVVDLLESAAPKNVNNFVFLSNQSYFVNTKVHRIIKDAVIQGGDRNTLDDDSTNDGRGSPGYFVQDEVNWDALDLSQTKRTQLSAIGYSSSPGLPSVSLCKYCLAMANSLPGTNGSQFFFVMSDLSDPRIEALNGQFTVIGKIYSGASVLDQINQISVNDKSYPDSPVYINKILITN